MKATNQITQSRKVQILKRREVEAMTTLSRSTIYRLMAAGKFPASIRLSANSVGWLESDVEQWIESNRTDRVA
jgi:prophage regulatory protein